jgi:hypothetical protein
MKCSLIIGITTAVAVLAGILTLVLTTNNTDSEAYTKTMNLHSYFDAVYPKADKYNKKYWKKLNFFYACAPKKIADSYGGVIDGSKTNYAPPPLNSAWFPIWFSPGTYAINQYPPERWWDYVHAEGFDSGDWVEMMHGNDDNPYYTVYGYWTYYTKGSGVWYNVGKTLKARNKLDALSKLGMSRDDIAALIQNTNYMTNAATDYQTIQSLADTLFDDTITKIPIERVKLLVDVASTPEQYTDIFTNSQLYEADRANNSADWDGDIVTLAWTHGFDSVQFTTQANGNGGWAHETVFCGMDQVQKDVEKTWGGWSWMTKRMAIGDPNTKLPRNTCTFDPSIEYIMVTCQEQPISSRAECIDTTPTPYPGQ